MNARSLKFAVAALVSLAGFALAADAQSVPDPDDQDGIPTRSPASVPPVIGCWFWHPAAGEPENFKPFIDHIAGHTAYDLLTTSIRIANRQMTDPDVVDATRRAAAYAGTKGIGLVPELGFWSSFNQAHPDEPLQLMRLLTTNLADQGEVTVETRYKTKWVHLQGWPFAIGPARAARVYSYRRAAQGADPGTIEDITASCRVVEERPGLIRIAIPCDEQTSGREACVLFSIDWQWPDIFNPKLPAHIHELLGMYADTGIAGACLDEFGLPAFRTRNELWYSPYWASAYAERTGGRDLIHDMFLIHVGKDGHAGERHGALNHYMEMTWQQHAKAEQYFYEATKAQLGPTAYVGTHPTWIAHIDDREIRRNGLDWWSVPRDYGQTDEGTPYCVRTALAKKCGGAVGYNMFYSKSLAPYYNEVWSTALVGLRVNYHPLYPASEDGLPWARKPLWQAELLRGDCRVRMLNFISNTQVDCPVAVVFGHASTTNWIGPGYGDAGDALANAFWQRGYYADLIPSSEIAGGALRLDGDGSIRYGDQKYAAVVLYRPEFERPATAQFFMKAAQGKTALYRLGGWTMDFEGTPFDGAAALPPEVTVVAGASSCVEAVTDRLHAAGIVPCTPAPARSGRSRLIGGTVIFTAGENDSSGDPIQTTFQVKGHDVFFDAIGIAAVRLADDGSLEAIAAGGLRRFSSGQAALELPQRADLALWKDGEGVWHGVLQDHAGEIPESLAAFCKSWIRLRVPKPRQ